MIELVILAMAVMAEATGATLVLYSVAALLGGAGRGDENVIFAQIWTGLVMLMLVHMSGVLY